MAVSYIDFVEERLEIGVDIGVVGGPSFKTEIIETGSGQEQRNGLWWQPLGRWQLGDRMLLDSNIDGIEEVRYLREFHASRSGSKQGFRFKDWCDYSAVGQVLGETDGITTRWQLKKKYSAGTDFTYRPILKPVQGTLHLYLDGEEINYAVVNYSNGIVSFAVPPSAGQILSADFEFDVPVQFEADKVEWTLKAAQLDTDEYMHKLGSVFVKEIRINLDLQWLNLEWTSHAPGGTPGGVSSPIPQIISEPLDLGIILDVTETVTFSTRSEKLASGYEISESDRDYTKTLVKLPTRKFDRQELEKILGYFWVAKGRLVSLTLKINNKLGIVRFNSDALSIKFLHFQELYEIGLMYLGILEQTLDLSDSNLLAILILDGTDFIDKSDNETSVVNNSLVFVDNGRYNLIEPNASFRATTPLFAFEDRDFLIEIEAQMTAFNTSSSYNYLCSCWASPANYQQFYFAINNLNELLFVFQDTEGNFRSVVTELPNNNYLNSFQYFKVERVENLLNLSYDNNLLKAENIGNVTLLNPFFKAITFASDVSTNKNNFNGYFRSILVKKDVS